MVVNTIHYKNTGGSPLASIGQELYACLAPNVCSPNLDRFLPDLMEQRGDAVGAVVFDRERNRLYPRIDFGGLMKEKESFLDPVLPEGGGKDADVDVTVLAGGSSDVGAVKQNFRDRDSLLFQEPSESSELV